MHTSQGRSTAANSGVHPEIKRSGAFLARGRFRAAHGLPGGLLRGTVHPVVRHCRSKVLWRYKDHEAHMTRAMKFAFLLVAVTAAVSSGAHRVMLTR